MTAYYNEIDPYAAEWLRKLIRDGHIAPGVVDERDIKDIQPNDLKDFTQCHFFAGIGVWSHVLRRAGWRDDEPVWTGSCPCQPFSAAGRRGGQADERHLWPHWYHLIAECRPDVVFGEQVASKDGLGWLDLVQADLEGAEYAVGALDSCSAGFGAPHIRQRLYFGAVGAGVAQGDANDAGPQGWPGVQERAGQRAAGPSGVAGGLANTERLERLGRRSGEKGGESGQVERTQRLRYDGRVGDSECERSLPGAHSGIHSREEGAGPRHVERERSGSVGGLANTDGRERDGIAGREGCESDRQATGRQQGDGEPQPGKSVGRLGHASGERCGEARTTGERCGEARTTGERFEERASDASAAGRPGQVNGLWRNADWLFCRDGKWRPVEPGTFPLAHGAASRVGRLRAYGNAINAAQAEGFIKSFREATNLN